MFKILFAYFKYNMKLFIYLIVMNFHDCCEFLLFAVSVRFSLRIFIVCRAFSLFVVYFRCLLCILKFCCLFLFFISCCDLRGLLLILNFALCIWISCCHVTSPYVTLLYFTLPYCRLGDLGYPWVPWGPLEHDLGPLRPQALGK